MLALLLAGAVQAQEPATPTAAPAAAPDAAAAPASPPGLYERVVATVNDDVITSYDLEQRTRLLIVVAGIQPTNDNLPEMEREALRSLIEERLELQELKHEEKQQKFSIIASDADVDDEIAATASANNTTPQQLLASLGQAGIGAETYRSQLRAEISWQRWIRGRYGSRLRIGEAQIKAFQQRMEAEAGKPRYQVAEVFIDAQRAGGPQAAMNEANQLIEQLHQGAPFAAVAHQFSADSTAANGGDLGWVTAGELPAEVVAALDQMRPGQLSAPIAVKDGVYIVNLRNKEAGGTSQIVDLKQAAIALAADAPADQVAAAQAKLEALRGKLHGCDNFEAIAGKADGVLAGDLGESDVRDLAPAFHDAATTVPVGEVSAPLRSDQGLHLIAVCSRRSNAGQGLDHDQIENRLAGEQLSMMSRRYLRDLSNSASIEIH
ncbi:MAG: peptidylprolyl isomerase [Caulobacteraceae bacterium]|nr:peptidylprolyl isomerase [Caulobacteraceae bacterium]